VLTDHSLLVGCTVPDAPITEEQILQAGSGDVNRPPKMYIKGVGSLMCIHFAGPEKELLQGLFWHHMLEKGVYMAQRGFVALSIEITEEHVDQFVGAVEEFVTRWSNALRW